VASAQRRTFRALVRYGTGASVRELSLLPIQPREVCDPHTGFGGLLYDRCRGAVEPERRARLDPQPFGMGVVEAVGPLAKRVRAGDRVIVPGTPQCGQCYECITGRADWCQFLSTKPAHPVAEMADGIPVFADGALGGLGVLMVVPEEYCCPVFTDVPAAELTMLGHTLGTGLAAGHNPAPVEPGSNVVVLGACPVGMGAIQAAKILGAGRVICRGADQSAARPDAQGRGDDGSRSQR
jgi:threonine dehydrogenase-like Zn-dependent dehydrogenase